MIARTGWTISNPPSPRLKSHPDAFNTDTCWGNDSVSMHSALMDRHALLAFMMMPVAADKGIHHGHYSVLISTSLSPFPITAAPPRPFNSMRTEVSGGNIITRGVSWYGGWCYAAEWNSTAPEG